VISAVEDGIIFMNTYYYSPFIIGVPVAILGNIG
jgi:hypothetical protein